MYLHENGILFSVTTATVQEPLMIQTSRVLSMPQSTGADSQHQTQTNEGWKCVKLYRHTWTDTSSHEIKKQLAVKNEHPVGRNVSQVNFVGYFPFRLMSSAFGLRNLSLFLSIYVSLCLSLYLSLDLFIYQSINQSI